MGPQAAIHLLPTGFHLTLNGNCSDGGIIVFIVRVRSGEVWFTGEQKTARTLGGHFCRVCSHLWAPMSPGEPSVSCLHFGVLMESVFSFCSACSQLLSCGCGCLDRTETLLLTCSLSMSHFICLCLRASIRRPLTFVQTYFVVFLSPVFEGENSCSSEGSREGGI